MAIGRASTAARDARNASQRYELKYLLPNAVAAPVVDWLRARLRPDPEFPAGTVSSIYYDRQDWRSLGEKTNSDFLKSKIRIRWYSQLDGTVGEERAFLEAKLKVGCRRRKIRVGIPVSGSALAKMSLADPQLRALPAHLHELGVCPAPDFEPVFEISYKRLRFVDDATAARCCLDYDIRAPRVNPLRLPFSRPDYLSTAVFEQKGEHDALLPSLCRLTALGLHKGSFSKYGACYRHLASEVVT